MPVRDGLTAKGFTEAPREKADFVVRARGQSVSNLEITDLGYRSYPYGVRRQGWGYSPGAVRWMCGRRPIAR